MVNRSAQGHLTVVRQRNGKDGSTGNGIKTIVKEYYKSTSSMSLVGGSWSTDVPTWTNGTYIWTRDHITYTNGTEAYTNPVNTTGAQGEQGEQGAILRLSEWSADVSRE